jgi:hypothetical protein
MFHKKTFQKGLLLLAAFTAFAFAPLAAEAGTLTLVNASASQLNAIYISDSGADEWEENLIQGYVLPSGNELSIQIQGSYSKFDLRIEAAGGGEEDYYEFPGNTRRIVIKGGGDSEYQ